MRRLLLVAALAALVLPSVALAHANIQGTTPGYRERVEAPPRAIVLKFDQRATALPGAIEVRAASGKLVPTPARTRPGDARAVEAPLPRLSKGAYTVRWRVLSVDGHVISGVYTFGVRHPAPPPTEAVGASGPTTAEHIVRWAYFLALALLVGGLGLRLLVVPRAAPAALERRLYAVTGIGVAAAVQIGIAAFLLRADGVLDVPFGRFLYADLQPIETGSRLGAAFIAMTLGYVLAASFLFLAWLLDRTVLLWPAFLLALGFASGFSISGHQASGPDSSWLSQLADWVHLSAALLWTGGLASLVLVLWPTAPGLRREAFSRFSRLATALVALLLAAGIYMSVLRLPQLDDLWSESYGQVLLVKLGLVAVALAWGALHHFLVRPALDRLAGEGLLVRVQRSLLGEGAVGMAILLVAAILVDTKPPPEPAAPPAQASTVAAPPRAPGGQPGAAGARRSRVLAGRKPATAGGLSGSAPRPPSAAGRAPRRASARALRRSTPPLRRAAPRP